MNFIFIEAKNPNTSEYDFIKSVLDKYFADKNIEIVCMDGVDNLFCPTIINYCCPIKPENSDSPLARACA